MKIDITQVMENVRIYFLSLENENSPNFEWHSSSILGSLFFLVYVIYLFALDLVQLIDFTLWTYDATTK